MSYPEPACSLFASDDLLGQAHTHSQRQALPLKGNELRSRPLQLRQFVFVLTELLQCHKADGTRRLSHALLVSLSPLSTILVRTPSECHQELSPNLL